MNPITIIRKGDDTPAGTKTFYCGRGSVLGNPHVMKNKSDAERNRVCDLYETGFPDADQKRACGQIAAAARNSPVALECFCTPKRCHLDTVKRYIEENYV